MILYYRAFLNKSQIKVSYYSKSFLVGKLYAILTYFYKYLSLWDIILP